MNRIFLLLFGMVTFVAHAQVPDYVPTEGLVAWYPFNGNANDESGNGQHGSMTDIQIVADRNGIPSAAFEFNGSSSFVEVESTPALSVSSAYTLSAWFNNYNWSFNSPDEHAIVSKIADGAWYGGYEIYSGSQFGEGTLRHIGNINGNFGPWTAGLSEFTWYHVIASFNGSSILLYINGEVVASANRNGLLQTSSIPLRMGRRGGAGSYNSWFEGVIDDVGIWNRALSEEEVLALYNAESPILGCTDSSACNFDSSSNTNDGTCIYPPEGAADCNTGASFCGDGTIWNPSQQECSCYNDCPSDLNGNGLVEVADLLLVLADFGEPCEPVIDLNCVAVSYQGYTYATAAIAGKCWFTENLRAEAYRNGDPIETLTGTVSEDCVLYYSGVGLVGGYSETWGCNSDCSTPFDPCEDAENALNTFGRYYNGYAILDSRGLCPSGWHPSTDSEWLALEMQAGMSLTEAETFGDRGAVSATLKTNGYWCDDNSGTDEIGFSALPAGSIFDDCGASSMAMGTGYWWSVSDAGEGVFRRLYAGNASVGRWSSFEWGNMYSIRCVRDE